MRYEVVLGPNTKQWWVYDNETDEFCDPPAEVLDEIRQHSEDVNEQETFFRSILAMEPDWLNEQEHRYDAEDMDI